LGPNVKKRKRENTHTHTYQLSGLVMGILFICQNPFIMMFTENLEKPSFIIQNVHLAFYALSLLLTL